MNYKEFLATKKIKTISTGFECDDFNPMLFDWQKDIVKWALKKGRACIFADCGLGKTPMQLEWANKVHMHTGKPVLIFAPLAVSKQTQREGEKFHINVNICRTHEDVIDGINITNYEMMEHFDPDTFGGLVLDESSIIKHQTSKTRTKILELYADTQFKLACTATPAPNDHMELGNHAEFVGAMTQTEMLSTFFINDASHGIKWRLKGHAKNSFWEWLASWACVITKPSDLGYVDNGFLLPELHIHEHITDSDNMEDDGQMMLIPKLANTLSERRQARRDSMEDRAELAIELLNIKE